MEMENILSHKMRYKFVTISLFAHFYSCGLSTATIEYSVRLSVRLSVCVCVYCVCVSVCLSVYMITQKIMVQST